MKRMASNRGTSGTFDAGLPVSVDNVSEADSAVCAHQVGLALCFWIAGEAFAAEP